MTFEGQYLTKDEYIALGGSSTIGDMPFNLLEFEARRKIDIRTQNRLVGQENIPQAVKLCEYALINAINGFAQTTGNVTSNGNVASENTDGYSISYLTPDKISEIVLAKETELEDIIRTYLLEVNFNDQHLMFVGID